MGVHPHQERTADVVRLAVVGDSSGDRDDVILVERSSRRAPAMSGRAERDALIGDRHVR